jgi:HEAT repeat protein
MGSVSDDTALRLAAARRRGDVAAAGWRGELASVRAGLADPDPTVRAAAVGALCRVGACTPAEADAACVDPHPVVRRAAAELGAGLPGRAVLGLLDDHDPSVVEAGCFAAGELGDPGAVPRLVALASDHHDPLCREAAVAALGAIGHEGGLPAILAALADAPAIRRRATVALAAFDGPEVDAALRGRLDDRDWQVRQAAEDLR